MHHKVPLTFWLPALGLAVLIACTEAPTAPPPPACVYTLSASALAVPVGGGSASVTVSTSPVCTWTAQTGTAWLSITGGASGTGPGTVTVAAQANTTTTARTGTVVIAGATVTVQQEGLAACSYALSPERASITADGGRGVITVTTAAHCAWQASADASWLRVTSGASGTGPGKVEYDVHAHPSPLPRSGTLTVAGHPFMVDQEGDVSVCTYQVSPVEFNLCMVWSGDRVSQVTTQEGCPWTAASSVEWVTVAGGSSGSGSGSVVLQGSDNWAARRTGIVEVRWPTATAGQNVSIDQGGCQYAVTVDSFAVAAGGGPRTFEVFQQSDPISCGGPLQNACLWSAVSSVPWITVTTSMPRTGDDTVSFVVAPNASSSPRTGSITVRDKVVRVSQGGSD